MKKNVLVLLTYPIDTDSRVKKEIKSLINSNFEVTLISVNSKEDFLKNHFIVETKPKRFKIYGLNFLTISIKFIFKIIKLLKKTDYIHCNDAQTLHLGLMAKFLKPRTKLIYDTHELATENGKSKLTNIWFTIIEKVGSKFASNVITVSPSISEWYKNKYKILNPLVVLNCPPKSEMFSKKNIFREKFLIQESAKIFLYQGCLAEGRGINIIIEAFKNLDKNKFVAVFMGYGRLVEEIQNASKCYPNIFFHKAVKQNELVDYTSSADWGLVLIENSCLSYYYSLPNKLFECVQAEIPVIASNLKELNNIVSTWNLGIVANQINGNGLLDAIKKTEMFNYEDFLSNLKNAKNEFCWEMQEKVLLSAYTDFQ